MINSKIAVMLVVAFVAGSFVASPELRAYAANTVGSIDIINESIQSVDIKNGQVMNADIAGSAVTSGKIASGAVANSDIAGNAVTSNKIADGTIAYGDVSRNLIAVEHRDDCNCGGTGWDPDGTLTTELIYDDRITPNSVIAISSKGTFAVICNAFAGTGVSVVSCTRPLPNGMEINYAIFNNPAYG